MDPQPTSNESELRSLLLRGLGGDSRAYHHFLLNLSVLLRKYVRKQLERFRRPVDDAEDVVQEALMAIHARRHTYEPDLPVTAWAYAITRYKLIDCLRATERFAEAIPLNESEAAVSPIDEMETVISIRKGIALLPEKLRIPIQLGKLEGLSAKEIADRTGTAEVTVRTNVHRGLKALARWCGVERRSQDENR